MDIWPGFLIVARIKKSKVELRAKLFKPFFLLWRQLSPVIHIYLFFNYISFHRICTLSLKYSILLFLLPGGCSRLITGYRRSVIGVLTVVIYFQRLKHSLLPVIIHIELKPVK